MAVRTSPFGSRSAVLLEAAPEFEMRRTDIETALRRLAPQMPRHEFGAVVDHALASPGLRKAAPEESAWLSLVAYVRHQLTDYDELLVQGYDQDSARYFVADEMKDVLQDWGVRRKLTHDES